VLCSVDWYFLGSDRLGRPPENGELSLLIHQGLIVDGSISIGWHYMGLRDYQGLWGPFSSWLQRKHPQAAAAMIATGEAAGGPGYQAPFWTPGTSYDLWAEYVDKWVASQQ
jgi:hypothetical protein